jgi:hypothetical protein
MSKQPPKQKTLDFFLQKPKQGSSSASNAAKKPVPKTTEPSKGGKQDSSAKSATVNTKSSSSTSKGVSLNLNGAENASTKKQAVEPRQTDRSSPPLTPPAFPSSRSVASDARSNASTPPTSEIVDLDGMEEEEDEVIRPVRFPTRI